MKISEIQTLLRNAIDAAEKRDIELGELENHRLTPSRSLMLMLNQALDEFDRRYEIESINDFDLPINPKEKP